MTLKSSRETLLTSLTNGGVRAFYGFGVFTTPCARIYPADPWVGQSGMMGGKRAQRWEIWAVSGKADAAANYEEMETLVMAINVVMEMLNGWGRVEWRRPGPVDMGGTKYLACRGTIETFAEA